jgi:hypothetical protein
VKMGEKEWYFFCHKDMKYPTGMQTNLATKEGIRRPSTRTGRSSNQLLLVMEVAMSWLA